MVTELNTKSAAMHSQFPNQAKADMGGLAGKTANDFVPMPWCMLVEVLAPETVTPGGVHLPEKFQEERCYGTVVALSPQSTNAGDFQIGDTVAILTAGGIQTRLYDPVSEKMKPYRICYYRGAIDDDVVGRFKRPGEK